MFQEVPGSRKVLRTPASSVVSIDMFPIWQCEIGARMVMYMLAHVPTHATCAHTHAHTTRAERALNHSRDGISMGHACAHLITNTSS